MQYKTNNHTSNTAAESSGSCKTKMTNTNVMHKTQKCNINTQSTNKMYLPLYLY